MLEEYMQNILRKTGSGSMTKQKGNPLIEGFLNATNQNLESNLPSFETILRDMTIGTEFEDWVGTALVNQNRPKPFTIGGEIRDPLRKISQARGPSAYPDDVPETFGQTAFILNR